MAAGTLGQQEWPLMESPPEAIRPTEDPRSGVSFTKRPAESNRRARPLKSLTRPRYLFESTVLVIYLRPLQLLRSQHVFVIFGWRHHHDVDHFEIKIGFNVGPALPARRRAAAPDRADQMGCGPGRTFRGDTGIECFSPSTAGPPVLTCRPSHVGKANSNHRERWPVHVCDLGLPSIQVTRRKRVFQRTSRTDIVSRCQATSAYRI